MTTTVQMSSRGILILDDVISIALNKQPFTDSLKQLQTSSLQELLKYWKEYQLIIEKELFERI